MLGLIVISVMLVVRVRLWLVLGLGAMVRLGLVLGY